MIKAVAEMSEFLKKRPGRGMGIAFADYHGTYTAGVAEVSVDQKTGKITVHNYWIATDPGIVLQPNQVHAQLESAVVFGLSAALLEELAVKDGAAQASNFNDYPVLRMADIPPIHRQDHRQREPADRYRRGGRPGSRAGDCQCGGAADR